ncbi:MAG: hypothetical protein AB1650_09635 [Candidatus Omnitrophota bacterium]
MKNTIVSVAVVVALLGCLLAVFANVSSSKLNRALDEERYKRMTAEQNLQKAEQNLSSAEAELGKAKSKMASIEKILNDGRLVEEQLKGELKAVQQENEELMTQLTDIQQTVTVAETQPEPAVEQ